MYVDSTFNQNVILLKRLRFFNREELYPPLKMDSITLWQIYDYIEVIVNAAEYAANNSPRHK